MKRMILFLAVLFMTVPAMAASNVTLTCDTDGNAITVSYVTDANLIRAFGLYVSADVNIKDVCVVDPNYRIFPGQIVIEDGLVMDYNTPYDREEINDVNLYVEMGSLYTTDPNYASDGNAGYGMIPGTSGELMKIYVDDIVGYCFTITEDPCRGGVVMEDPDEEPVVNLTDCNACQVCTVPSVVGEDYLVAEAAIDACNLVASTSGLWNDVVAKDLVISQDPTGTTEVDCGSTVSIVVSRGPEPPNPIPAGDPNYSQQYTDAQAYIDNFWDPNEGSGGWGKKYHCFGDADGATEGLIIKFRISIKDLNYITGNWKKQMGPWPNGANPAADVDHKAEGLIIKFRVSVKDLNRITCYWKKTDADLNSEPMGRTCPMKDSDNDAWSCPY